MKSTDTTFDPSSTGSTGGGSFIARILEREGVQNYFFLDLTLPTTVRLAMKENQKRIAVRVSEYEAAETALNFAGKVDWVWVDSFKGAPPEKATLERLKASFRLCLVSPELQGHPPETIQNFAAVASYFEAVCTKHPELWAGK